jgi:beta-lactam-binding protein with PASTA domain
VLRQRENAARNLLEDQGFQVDSQDVPIGNQNLDGRVIAQSPRPDTTVPEGSTVQILIGQVQ